MPENLAPEVWAFEEDLGSRIPVRAVRAGRGEGHRGAGTAVDPEVAFLAALHALAGGEDLAKALACKGWTKFGENLSGEGMAAMLDEWSSCEFPNVCPHGRPIVKRVALADLLREFGRF